MKKQITMPEVRIMHLAAKDVIATSADLNTNGSVSATFTTRIFGD